MEKYCIDCKHYNLAEKSVHSHKVFMSWEEPECRRNMELNIVNKKPISGTILNCDAEREDALRLEQFRCGKDGKYWEAK